MENFSKKFISGVVLVTMATYTMPIYAFANEETVYSKLMADGEKYKTIVSTTFENENETENTQVETDKALPVDCEVTYELDGKEISVDDIAGKSGNIKITLHYINNSKNILKINGKNENIYTPFVVIAGAIIDNDNNTDIEITNGKAINSGNKTIVVGFAMPGMQESLGLSKEDIDVPDTIEITMNSTNFEIGNIMSYCSPKLLDEEIDFSKFDELFDMINELQDAINKIEEGTIELKDGVSNLNGGTQALDDGVGVLNTGIGTLKSGTSALNEGAQNLKSGVEEYTSNAQVFNSKMAEVSAGAKSLRNGFETIDAGILSISESSSQLVDGTKSALELANSLNETTTISVDYTMARDAINTAISANNSSINALQESNAEISNQIANLEEYPEAQAVLQNVLNTNNSKIEELTNSITTLNNTLATLNATEMTVTTNNAEQIVALQRTLSVVLGGLELVESGANELKNASSTVKSGMSTLEENNTALLEANNQLTQVAGALSAGVVKFASGVEELDSGVTALVEGSNELKNGTSALANGTNALLEGVVALSDGITEFNNEGIKKITNEVNGNVKSTIERVEKLQELSNEYNKFGSDEQRDGIKFISIMNSIKNSAKEDTGEEAILNSEIQEKEDEK